MKVLLSEIRFYKSVDALQSNSVEKQTESQLLRLIFSNSVDNLLEFLQKITPLCRHTWLSAQNLIGISSLRPYHKSYLCLLQYFNEHNKLNSRHSNNCTCMQIDLNFFNIYGITPFLKSLPCNYDILSLQIEMGANLNLSPRCSLFIVINPLFAYMKHLVNQVYDQVIDDIDVVLCLSLLCTNGLDPNYVPQHVCSNLMVLFSIAADISIQSDFGSPDVKLEFLNYLDQILKVLLKGGLNPTLRNNTNKLSYEVHGDGLFDFIFMLKYPCDEISIAHIYRWIVILIQYGCDPELEMRSKCRDLLKFKLIKEKPNIALSVFYYVINELFDNDFINSSNIQRIHYVLESMTSIKMKNLTISYFKKSYTDSMFSQFFSFQVKSLKHLARYSVVSEILHYKLLDIEKWSIPKPLMQYVMNIL